MEIQSCHSTGKKNFFFDYQRQKRYSSGVTYQRSFSSSLVYFYGYLSYDFKDLFNVYFLCLHNIDNINLRICSVTRSASAQCWRGNRFDSQSNRDKAKDVKSCTYFCYVRCATLIVCVGGNTLAPNRRNSIPCTVRTSKALFVCIQGKFIQIFHVSGSN